MCRLLKLLIVLYFSLDYYTFATECEFGFGFCWFVEVKTNSTNLYFHPSSPSKRSETNSTIIYTNPPSPSNGSVTSVAFEDSVMPTLTDELCRAFPDLKYLLLEFLSMENIAPNALDQCHNLSVIAFNNNKLKVLDKNLFKMNTKLKVISFHWNLLETIDGRMFDFVPELERLNLIGNQLTNLPLEQFPVMNNLKELIIQENNLVDLDDQELIIKFPNLQKIYMYKNKFDRNRLPIILKALHDKNISVPKHYDPDQHLF